MNRRDLLSILSGTLAGSSLATFAPDDLLARGINVSRPGRHPPAGPFTPHEFATVSAIVDLIIPETDTPGAKAAKVPEFIGVIVGEWYRDDERATFLAGLGEVDARSQRATGKNFVEAPPVEQIALLTGLDRELQAMKQQKQATGSNFFQRIKGLAIYGYYTSEIGMTRELHYQVIPGRYDPCMPM